MKYKTVKELYEGVVKCGDVDESELTRSVKPDSVNAGGSCISLCRDEW